MPHLFPLNNALPTVLYVDDEPANCQAFAAAFRREFNVLTASGPEGTWAVLERQEVHVMICDQRMPGVNGAAMLRQVKDRFPRVRRMLITAHADLQALVDALNSAGVCHYIQKPWEVEDVRSAVREAWEAHLSEHEREVFTERLLESNRQLEFALRQSLLS